MPLPRLYSFTYRDASRKPTPFRLSGPLSAPQKKGGRWRVRGYRAEAVQTPAPFGLSLARKGDPVWFWLDRVVDRGNLPAGLFAVLG